MILSNESFWHVLSHAGVNEKTRSRPLAVRKLRRQFVQNDDTRKKNVSKLTTAIKLYVNVS